MKLEARFIVLIDHVEVYKYYAKEPAWLLERSLGFFIAKNLNALSSLTK